jgi:hypothetical protein
MFPRRNAQPPLKVAAAHQRCVQRTLNFTMNMLGHGVRESGDGRKFAENLAGVRLPKPSATGTDRITRRSIPATTGTTGGSDRARPGAAAIKFLAVYAGRGARTRTKSVRCQRSEGSRGLNPQALPTDLIRDIRPSSARSRGICAPSRCATNTSLTTICVSTQVVLRFVIMPSARHEIQDHSCFGGWHRQLVVGVPKASEVTPTGIAGFKDLAIKSASRRVANLNRTPHLAIPSDWPAANTDNKLSVPPKSNGRMHCGVNLREKILQIDAPQPFRDEDRLRGIFDIDGNQPGHLHAAGHFFHFLHRRSRTNPRTDTHWGRKTDAVQPVVNAHSLLAV